MQEPYWLLATHSFAVGKRNPLHDRYKRGSNPHNSRGCWAPRVGMVPCQERHLPGGWAQPGIAWAHLGLAGQAGYLLRAAVHCGTAVYYSY